MEKNKNKIQSGPLFLDSNFKMLSNFYVKFEREGVRDFMIQETHTYIMFIYL